MGASLEPSLCGGTDGSHIQWQRTQAALVSPVGPGSSGSGGARDSVDVKAASNDLLHSRDNIQAVQSHGSTGVAALSRSGSNRVGLPPRPPAASPSPLPTRPSSGASVFSNYSVQALALGRGGRAGGMRQRGAGGLLSRGGSGGGSDDNYDDDDVDSVDLALMRIRHENNRDDGSINIVDDEEDAEDAASLMSELRPTRGPAAAANAARRQLGRTPRKQSSKQGVCSTTLLGGCQGAAKLRLPGQQQAPAGPSTGVARGPGRAGATKDASPPPRSRAPLSRLALLRQAAPMVLSLENLKDSTPEVLELELGRMSLEELLRLDAKMQR